jgi:hypothetical protein
VCDVNFPCYRVCAIKLSVTHPLKNILRRCTVFIPVHVADTYFSFGFLFTAFE